MTSQTLSAGFVRTERGAAASFLERLLVAWREHRRYQRTVSELGSLSDRELDDIGLSRGDICQVARRCVARRH